jgi:hypothetical protein
MHKSNLWNKGKEGLCNIVYSAICIGTYSQCHFSPFIHKFIYQLPFVSLCTSFFLSRSFLKYWEKYDVNFLCDFSHILLLPVHCVMTDSILKILIKEALQIPTHKNALPRLIPNSFLLVFSSISSYKRFLTLIQRNDDENFFSSRLKFIVESLICC